MEPENERLAAIVAPVVWKYAPMADLHVLEALPPAARERETRKAVDTFASTGRNVFVHYTAPILDERRKRLLAAGLRKKKYSKSAAQLWQSIGEEEQFYWNEAARYLRQCMKQGVLSHKDCLIHGGRVDEKKDYIWNAEVAVAAYLELPAPAEKRREEVEVAKNVAEQETKEIISKFELFGVSDVTGNESLKADAAAKGDHERASAVLLDTLPEPFSYEPKMLYSHFARYEYNEIRKAEGKHQTAMLRQLADLFDKTGKILFYYYAVPRLCKQTYPPTLGETVTSQAADVWKLLPGTEKEKWCNASASVKKRLGDGDPAGLSVLELDTLDEEVVRLHEFAAEALKAHDQKN
jgi:hypothetical protein